jgi:hypothetical protein
MSPAKKRGTALQDRVLRRYRDRSPWGERVRKLLTGIVFLGWLGGIVLLFGIVRTLSSPSSMAIGLVVGVAISLLIALSHRRSQAERLWQSTRHEPIRRRSWLRWLGVGRAVTCPYCRDDLGVDLCECPECEACYHPECAEELPACATLGCEGIGSRAPQPRAKSKPTVSLLDPSLSPGS